MLSTHDRTASRIARRERTEYNRGPGADILTSRRAIHVASARSVRNGMRQLQGYRRPVYIAGADPAATRKALEVTEGTTVGVMTSGGKVVRRSTRRR